MQCTDGVRDNERHLVLDVMTRNVHQWSIDELVNPQRHRGYQEIDGHLQADEDSKEELVPHKSDNQWLFMPNNRTKCYPIKPYKMPWRTDTREHARRVRLKVAFQVK